MARCPRRLLPALVAVATAACGAPAAASADPAESLPTTTPIKHLIVLFQENQSFDHYFGTYPNAANLPGEIPFTPAPGTPSVNGLSGPLLTANANLAQPKRIAPADMLARLPCDNNHAYTAEQAAMNGGGMDRFVQSTQGSGAACQPSVVMDYYDGNTVTALWNYAQRYAISDQHFGTTFGPSTIGHINLVSGTTRNPIDANGQVLPDTPGTVAGGAAIGNRNPHATFDGCSSGVGYAFDDAAGNNGAGTHQNVGDLLSAGSVSWGWFQRGFDPTSRLAPDATYPHGRPVCGRTSKNAGGGTVSDYFPHHNPFAYFRSTANPEHLPPSAPLGGPDPDANHQYDTTRLTAALEAGNVPAVSIVKAPAAQDGHPGYSDPLSEQRWLVDTINAVQRSAIWPTTAILVAWDDSDGWYDHVVPPVARASATTADVYDGPNSCHVGIAPTTSPGRCGFGPRLPLVAISPFARRNHVDHTVTDQTSILRFIEDNWGLGRIGGDSADAVAGSLGGLFDFLAAPRTQALVLDPATGALPGTVPLPTPTPTSAPPTPTPAAASPPPVAAPTPTPSPARLGRLSCRAKRAAKGLTVTVICTGERAPSGATRVTVSVLAKTKPARGKVRATLVQASASTSTATVRLTLRPRRRLGGRYPVVITSSDATGAPVRQTLTLRL